VPTVRFPLDGPNSLQPSCWWRPYVACSTPFFWQKASTIKSYSSKFQRAHGWIKLVPFINLREYNQHLQSNSHALVRSTSWTQERKRHSSAVVWSRSQRLSLKFINKRRFKVIIHCHWGRGVSTVPLPRPRCLDRPLITESCLVISRKTGQLTQGSKCLHMLNDFNAWYSLNLFHIFRADRSRGSLASVLSADDWEVLFAAPLELLLWGSKFLVSAGDDHASSLARFSASSCSLRFRISIFSWCRFLSCSRWLGYWIFHGNDFFQRHP
jgi:hypothetical protein